MSYSIRKTTRGWTIQNETTGSHIGDLKSRKEALAIARLLAGWRGQVHLVKS